MTTQYYKRYKISVQQSFYIIPGMPPMLGWSLFFSGIDATTASVVKNIAATLAACCNAERVTLVGSTIPASNILTHSFVAALKPTPGSAFFKRSTMTDPSNPAFSAI